MHNSIQINYNVVQDLWTSSQTDHGWLDYQETPSYNTVKKWAADFKRERESV